MGIAEDPQETIAWSYWATCGWTFQEALLSRCCLVFTDDRMCFECQTINCFEVVHTPLDELHGVYKMIPIGDVRRSLFGKN
jgi:hypothetical protein